MAPMLFADAIMKGNSIKVFNNGDMERDFTYIETIVDGVVKILNKSPSICQKIPFYQVFNIGNSRPTKLLDFISELEMNLGKKAKKEFLFYATRRCKENIC